MYVDNILLTGNNNDEIQAVKKLLHTEFTIRDLGEVDYFLGIQLVQIEHGIAMS